YLRVATTVVRHEESAGDPWGRAETANRVSVMAEEDGALKVVGQTPDLAQGERIFSSRFVGRRGFLVTFRQVDPFFTLDLSNPRDPKVVGELKIPGFSTYIHPVDENHLLTIGSYVNPDGGWQGRAIKLSLFDVSDFAAPKEKFSQLVGSSYASSEAQYDHRAFNYFPEKGLLAVPFVDWNAAASGDGYWSSFVSELRVFHIDTQAGITGRGALSMSDVYRTERYPDWTYSWSPQVRRSVMADDFVYAVTDAGLRVANIADLSAPLKTVRFEPNAP
ncbi:MAG TPA: beta-propeller domain-containing protein, partial [Myxococcaceae bacterium]|nr:beta-propeller domain-containing protein [Myxococcaceae bacterium]